jgi:hypothetical protein
VRERITGPHPKVTMEGPVCPRFRPPRKVKRGALAPAGRCGGRFTSGGGPTGVVYRRLMLSIVL